MNPKSKKNKKEQNTKPKIGVTLGDGNKFRCDGADHAENQTMNPRIHENYI